METQVVEPVDRNQEEESRMEEDKEVPDVDKAHIYPERADESSPECNSCGRLAPDA